MFFVRSYGLAMVLIVLIGFCNIVFLNQSNASFQFSIPNELRGRIVSVYVLLSQGTTPFGSLYVGGMIDLTSGIWGFPACGLISLFLLVPVLMRNRVTLKRWFTTIRPRF